MADTAKYGLLRKILKAIGLSETAITDLIDWISDRLADEQQESLAGEVARHFPYRIRDDFLSPAERSFCQVLRGVAGTRFLICPKVSLADLFYAKSGDPREYRVHTNKIDRKHVDFVLCDPQTLTPLAGIELDDKSHERSDRNHRDEFVEGVFTAAGLKLLRVRAQHGYSTQELTAMLEFITAPPSEPTVPQAAQSSSESPRINGQPNSKEKSVAISSLQCPKCGSEMVLRTAKKGTNEGQQFWGCSNFPRCRAMVPYEPVAA